MLSSISKAYINQALTDQLELCKSRLHIVNKTLGVTINAIQRGGDVDGLSSCLRTLYDRKAIIENDVERIEEALAEINKIK